MNASFVELSISFSTRESATEISKLLVENRLIACAQIFPIYSIYEWQGVQSEEEFLMKAKTIKNRLDAIEQLVKEKHPYDVPQMTAVPILWGHQPYLDWVKENTQ